METILPQQHHRLQQASFSEPNLDRESQIDVENLNFLRITQFFIDQQQQQEQIQQQQQFEGNITNNDMSLTVIDQHDQSFYAFQNPEKELVAEIVGSFFFFLPCPPSRLSVFFSPWIIRSLPFSFLTGTPEEIKIQFYRACHEKKVFRTRRIPKLLEPEARGDTSQRFCFF